MGFWQFRFNPTATAQTKVYFVLAGVSLFCAFCQTICTQQKEITSLNQRSPEIDLSIEELVRHRSAGDIAWQYADIFIQVSAHLHAPPSVLVKYAVDLVRGGTVTHTRLIDDVREWRIIDRNYYKQLSRGIVSNELHQDAQPLPSSLSVISKSDGWLHFQLEGLSDIEITKSKLRLTAASPHGMVYVEKDLAGTLIRPLIVQRRVTMK